MAQSKLIVPEYHAVARIGASQLAAWLAEHADRWWTADGESQLMETLSFPCPGNELADAIRKFGDQQVEILQDRLPPFEVSNIGAGELGRYANTENRYDARNFLLRWYGTRRLWLLSEDVPASLSSEDEANGGN